MIAYKQTDIMNEPVEALVNPVNCVGVMGRGLALRFKQEYPENFRFYALACSKGEVKLGHVHRYSSNLDTWPKYIFNFPTKGHWREKSFLVDIETGLQSLVEAVLEWHVKSIGIPALGCGLGGLWWTDVKPLIETAFSALPDVETIVCEPK